LEQVERMLAEAAANRGRVLINPTPDEIRQKADELRLQGRLFCTFCRRPIADEAFATRRINFGSRLQAVAHLHQTCEAEFAAAMEERTAAREA
jgi:hypothetical protein